LTQKCFHVIKLLMKYLEKKVYLITMNGKISENFSNTSN
jgi:hypothetical protein